MPENRSPATLFVTSAARSVAAIQKHLEDAVSSNHSLSVFSPFWWLPVAADAISAALTGLRQTVVPAPDVPVAAAPRTSHGWGPMPFGVPPAEPPQVPPPAPAPPPVPAPVVQALMDQAALFRLYSLPRGPLVPLRQPGNETATVGFTVEETLHRFVISSAPADARTPLTASNTIGEPSAVMSGRWLFTRDEFPATPGAMPPPVPFDRSRSQRFVLFDSQCRFEDTQDGFIGFGTGQTFPAKRNGREEIAVTAIATVLQGFGRFDGLTDSTYIYQGILDPDKGFRGQIMLLAADPQGAFQTTDALPPLTPGPLPDQGVTWLTIRGQAAPADSFEPLPGDPGKPADLRVFQGIQMMECDFSVHAAGGLRAAASIREFTGRLRARISFDPAAAAGSSSDPIPFSTLNEYTFLDSFGRPIGGFVADLSEGRVFKTLVGGAEAIRFGGTGSILQGTGPFAGISGTFSDNSIVCFNPHTSVSVYTLRVEDPDGRFVSRLGKWSDIPSSEVVRRKEPGNPNGPSKKDAKGRGGKL